MRNSWNGANPLSWMADRAAEKYRCHVCRRNGAEVELRWFHGPLGWMPCVEVVHPTGAVRRRRVSSHHIPVCSKHGEEMEARGYYGCGCGG
jgi:hypothetical protein